MRVNIRQIIISVIAWCCFNTVFGQLRNFGSKAEVKPKPNYTFGAYAHIDLFRETGIGFQYQLINKYNFDISCYVINKHIDISSYIKQWDYYDLKGYGLSFKPKYLISKLSRFYVGANIAYENLSHDKVWVEYYNGRGTDLYKNLEGTKGWGYTIGLTIGSMLEANHILFEPFFGIGITSSELSKTIYETDQFHPDPNVVYPFNEKIKFSFFQMNIGLKMGFLFKKNKNHEAIDKKFDKVYIPKSNSLKAYFKSINFRDPRINKDMRHAYARFEALNRNALSQYRRYYSDSTMFYKKIDFLFDRIDSIIVKATQ